jgi:hypothetical protein
LRFAIYGLRNLDCWGIPLNAFAFRGMVRAHQDKSAAAQEFGCRERHSAAAWSVSATGTIPPATKGAAESPYVPVSFLSDFWGAVHFFITFAPSFFQNLLN